jgi:hypothetical protein
VRYDAIPRTGVPQARLSTWIEWRGMPGYKEALKSSADNIDKAQKAVKAAQKAVQNER